MKYLTIFISIIYFTCYSQQYSKSWKDVNYAGDTNVYHRLDIYLPMVQKATYPVVISIYGSAWFSNNSKGADLATIGKAMLDSGFAVVFPNHRSSIDAKYPAQIQDIKAVIRFVRANAEQYQLDTSFIGITGCSSGGYLAALAGTSGYVKQYTVGSATADIEGNVGQYTSFSSAVHAVVDWFGPTDLLKMDSCKTNSTIDHNSPSAPEAILIGGPVQENKDKCALANPITYIDANDPPFLIIHGEQDPIVSYCQSGLLFNALQNAGVLSQFVLVPNGQHGPGVLVDQYLKMMTDFFIAEAKITKIDAEEQNSPVKFSILQNYPNPFNSITIIKFTISEKSFVKLEIYDSLGREVSRLVSEELSSGTYRRQWNAKGLSNGTYFVRLQIGSYIETKKLAIIR